MKAKLVTCFAVATLAGASASAHAAEPAATAARVHKGQGTVKKVEMEAAKVNLAHGAIPSLNWPAMTMDFQVKDQAILKDIKPGQKVEFELVKGGEGQYLISRIAPAK